MASHDNIGSSNPSAPIGSNQFLLIVDEDNATPSSPLLDRPKDVQPNNEIIEEEEKYKSIVWNHFKRKRVYEKDEAECYYCKKLLIQLWH